MAENPNSKQNIKRDLDDVDKSLQAKKPEKPNQPSTEEPGEADNPRRKKFIDLHGKNE